MTDAQPTQQDQTDPQADLQTGAQALVADDLIEEVSIDGMCGVY